MKPPRHRDRELESDPSPQARGLRTFIGVCVLLLLIGAFFSSRQKASPPALTGQASQVISLSAAPRPASGSGFRRQGVRATPLSAEEIVASKLAQFTQSRRALARSMAKKKGVKVPDDVEKFFATLESGDWAETERQFNELGKRSGQYEGSTHSEELNPVWCAVLDAYGVAEQVHLWPAQELLDYGGAILDSLRPGMVYVGGTDNGRWIPELLNETSGGEQHIIITQNALADSRYLEFVNTLYGDRFSTVSDDEAQQVFQTYVQDAQRRFEHDQRFPDEPRQIRPGEDVKEVDGKVEVGGQTVVMAINEKLLQTFMAKNPDLSFALQESFPLKGTYADAMPLGPLMELRAQDAQTGFTPRDADQSLDFWRSAAEKLFANPDGASSSAFKSYSHDAVSAANLLAARNFPEEAEEAYRLASRLWPENPEPIGGLADVLKSGGREAEARRLLAEFERDHPDRWKDLLKAREDFRTIGTAPGGQK